MCGIAGILQFGAQHYGMEHIKKMTTALSHRGPDGESHWSNSTNEVLLGHRRLAIIDLSENGCQPFAYLDRYLIIHNGEIFNYKELREELSSLGYSFRSQTDTEVITAAYDAWGEACVDHFDGMFAFAIWDEKDQSFFAARDRFGEKPFFYYASRDCLVFASEMKALWSAGIDRIPNKKMLFNYLTIGYATNPTDPGETFFENIFRLPAASTLFFSRDEGQLIIERYWDLDPSREDKKITDSEAIEKFNALFNTAIKRRLRSDVAVGSSLSGGLDSSAVLAAASSLGALSLSSFTAAFRGYEKDESGDAKAISSLFSVTNKNIELTSADLIGDWEKICYHQEEPFGSASAYPQFKVFELAKNNGVRVLLDGQGADEVLAGYHKYYKWYWQELFRRRKLYRSHELSHARKNGIDERFDLRNMVAAYFPDVATVLLERQYLLRALRHEDLDRDFVKLQSREAYYTTPAHFTLNGALYFNTVTHGLEELLRYADRNAMAHGCEPRLPFLSHELVEFVFSLPAKFKIREGRTKWLLRRAMKERLPDTLTENTRKIGFEPPQEKWMKDPIIADMIIKARGTLIDAGVLKKEVINKPIDPRAAHAADNFDWRYLSAASLFK